MDNLENTIRVRRLHNLHVSIIEVWALERQGDVDIFVKSREILDKMYDLAQVYEAYSVRYLDWLERKTSTISLRELCSEVGYKFLRENPNSEESLLISNAINTIDSSRLWWQGKKESILVAEIDRLQEKYDENGYEFNTLVKLQRLENLLETITPKI